MPSHGPAMVDGLLLFSFIVVGRDILDLDYLGLDLDYLGLGWDERGRKGILFIVFCLISDSANIVQLGPSPNPKLWTKAEH